LDRRIVTAALLAVVIAGGLWLRHYLSPPQVIRRSLFRAVEAFEAERLISTLTPFFKGYNDAYGQDFELLAGNVKMVMDTYDDLDLELEVVALGLEEEQYRMEIRFVLDGRYQAQRGHILGSPQEPCRATLVWAEKPDGHKIITTQEVDIPRFRDELRARHDPTGKPH
jgi:hypothetical protein